MTTAIHKYRQPNEYYFDEYDRDTIEILKQLELEEKDSLFYSATSKVGFEMSSAYNVFTKFYNKGVFRASSRESLVRKRITEDEKKDRLIANTPLPQHLKCNICDEVMVFYSSMFDFKGHPVVFLFDCRGKHKSRKLILPDRNELNIPKPVCSRCSGFLQQETRKTLKKLICKDTCQECGQTSSFEYDLIIPAKLPINEIERKKYCVDFIGRTTFMDDLRRIESFMKRFPLEENESENNMDISKVKILTISKLESCLNKELKPKGFIKLLFEKTELKNNVIVSFSVQDSLERESHESIKALGKALRKILLETNWRLMGSSNSELSCRLGHLTGRLKGIEDKPGLVKLAKEINRCNAK